VEPLELGEHGDALLRREQVELSFLIQAPELVEPVDPARDRAPVREQAAEPAMVHVRHADALRLLLDRVLGLLLRADEEHRPASLGEIARERGRLFEKLERLLEIDDVDPAALAEDEAAHLGIPAAGLVAGMD